MWQVVDGYLRSVSHYDSHVVAELFVGDQIVTIAVHLIESLYYIHSLNPRRDQSSSDLMPFKAAQFRTLLLKNLW